MNIENLLKIAISSVGGVVILLVTLVFLALGITFLIKSIIGFFKKAIGESEESNLEIGPFKFSKKGKGKHGESTQKDSQDGPGQSCPPVALTVTKNNIINCVTQSIDEVIQYYTETNEIRNQLLKAQLTSAKRILTPLSFTLTQAYKIEQERRNKDTPKFDIRYDDSSWFFGKLVELDFETLIMHALDEAYSRNHLTEKNEEEFQTYCAMIAKTCIKALEASINNYRNPVDLTIARSAFDANKDELFRQICACIADARRQSEENQEQVLERTTECNNKLVQIMTINIPDIKPGDIGTVVQV